MSLAKQLNDIKDMVINQEQANMIKSLERVGLIKKPEFTLFYGSNRLINDHAKHIQISCYESKVLKT
jgi:hypothetical protein